MAVFSAWAMASTLAACKTAATGIPAGAPAEGVTVLLEVTPILEGNSLTIEGTTDLPDGASLIGEVREGNDPFSGTGDELPTMVVAGGRFSTTYDAAELPSGPIAIWVAFQPAENSQPKAVQELYGAKGEKLSGPNVVEHTPSEGARRVEVEVSIDKP
jgi:hypothetical protein